MVTSRLVYRGNWRPRLRGQRPPRVTRSHDPFRNHTPLILSTLPPGTPGGGIFLCTSGTTGRRRGSCAGRGNWRHVERSTRGRLAPADEPGTDRGVMLAAAVHVNAEVFGRSPRVAPGSPGRGDRKFAGAGWDLDHHRRSGSTRARDHLDLSMDPPGRTPARAPLRTSALAKLRSPPRAIREVNRRAVIEDVRHDRAARMITANPLDGAASPDRGAPAGWRWRIGLPAARRPKRATSASDDRGGRRDHRLRLRGLPAR